MWAALPYCRRINYNDRHAGRQAAARDKESERLVRDASERERVRESGTKGQTLHC